MGKLIVVQGDKVQGTDKHNVAGNATNPSAPPPTVPYKGVGDFEYDGTMVNGLCTFVKIGGRPVAVVSSQSMLDANGQINHTGPKGSNFQPPSPPPIAATLTITDPIGVGSPSATAGSTFVSLGGAKVLLDGDKIDTCDGTSQTMNSTVTASGQSFVSCGA
jgi:hypothetical protein